MRHEGEREGWWLNGARACSSDRRWCGRRGSLRLVASGCTDVRYFFDQGGAARHGRDSTRRFSRAAQEGGGREEGASSETILENTGRSGGRLKQRQQ
jgi:hypothetical protein